MATSSQQLFFQSRKFAARPPWRPSIFPGATNEFRNYSGNGGSSRTQFSGETHKKDKKLKAGHPEIAPDALAGQKFPLAQLACSYGRPHSSSPQQRPGPLVQRFRNIVAENVSSSSSAEVGAPRFSLACTYRRRPSVPLSCILPRFPHKMSDLDRNRPNGKPKISSKPVKPTI